MPCRDASATSKSSRPRAPRSSRPRWAARRPTRRPSSRARVRAGSRSTSAAPARSATTASTASRSSSPPGPGRDPDRPRLGAHPPRGRRRRVRRAPRRPAGGRVHAHGRVAAAAAAAGLGQVRQVDQVRHHLGRPRLRLPQLLPRRPPPRAADPRTRPRRRRDARPLLPRRLRRPVARRRRPDGLVRARACGVRRGRLRERQRDAAGAARRVPGVAGGRDHGSRRRRRDRAALRRRGRPTRCSGDRRRTPRARAALPLTRGVDPGGPAAPGVGRRAGAARQPESARGSDRGRRCVRHRLPARTEAPRTRHRRRWARPTRAGAAALRGPRDAAGADRGADPLRDHLHQRRRDDAPERATALRRAAGPRPGRRSRAAGVPAGGFWVADEQQVMRTRAIDFATGCCPRWRRPTPST